MGGAQILKYSDGNAAPEIDDVSIVGWDGFASSRRRITQGWVDANVRNAVVLTGDVHRNWANDLKGDDQDLASPGRAGAAVVG